MASLTGNQINTTYPALVKFDDNTAVTGTLKALTDGAGNTLPIEVSSTGVNFTGTVTGIPGGSAGVITGGTATAMETSLTDLPANADGYGSVAFGRNASATAGAESGIAIGNYAASQAAKAIAIGSEVTASASNSQAYGWNTTANAAGAIALGSGVTASKANTTTTKALELTTPSTPTDGGIILTDAGSTQRRVNIDASGNLQVDGNAVGVKPVISDLTLATETTTGADLIYHSILIPANTFGAGDILSLSSLIDMDDSNGGSIYWSGWLSPSTALLSGFTIGGGQVAYGTPVMTALRKTIFIHTSNGTGQGTSWMSDITPVDFYNSNDGSAQYNDSAVRAVDWTVNQYLNLQVYIDNSGNYIKHLGTVLNKVN